MLSPRGRMEEFITEEEEPWYDQQDLEQGKTPQRTGTSTGRYRSGLRTKDFCRARTRENIQLKLILSKLKMLAYLEAGTEPLPDKWIMFGSVLEENGPNSLRCSDV